jgi:1-deoxyxylulose-5-phosphate synthase
MKFHRLGKSGLEVSGICLGMMTFGTPQWRDWILPEAQARPIVKHAVEHGINFFDTADMYSFGESEIITGRLLREFFKQREDYVLATKLYFNVEDQNQRQPNRNGLSRKYVFAAIDASLKRLGTDYIDLYQIHRFDPNTPVEETMEALHDVVKAGKARYIGASSMFAWQFMSMQQAARAHGWTPFVSMQNHYNLVYREEEREMIPLCKASGVGLIPWSPLARGLLAGNRSRDGAQHTSRGRTDEHAQKWYGSQADFDVVDQVTAVAKARGVSNAVVAYAWLMHQGVVAPIVGASKAEQLDAPLAALEFKLSADELKQLQAPYQPHPVIGHA